MLSSTPISLSITERHEGQKSKFVVNKNEVLTVNHAQNINDFSWSGRIDNFINLNGFYKNIA